jgi:hypothetical protein
MIKRRRDGNNQYNRLYDEFQCFKCSKWYHAWSYTAGNRGNILGPDDLESMHVVHGHYWACDECFLNSDLRRRCEVAEIPVSGPISLPHSENAATALSGPASIQQT